MKMKLKRALSLILCLALCAGLCVNAFAANEENVLGVVFNAALSKSEIEVSETEQTVTMTVAMSKEVSLDSVEFRITTPDGFALSEPTMSYKASGLASWNANDKSMMWMSSGTDATGVTELMQATVTIPAGTPAGTYEFTVYGIKLSSNMAYWETRATASTTLTITSAIDPGPDPVPGESDYTLTISDGVEGTAEVKVGSTVNMTVSVTGAIANGVDAVVTYNTAFFECSKDAGKTGKIAITELNKSGVTGTVETLAFTAIAEGTGVFGFDTNATNTAGTFNDFKTSNALGANMIGDTVKVYSTYSVTIAASEYATAINATPNTDIKEGTVVELSATPKNGYELESWNVTCNGSPVAVTNNKFTMPKGNVYVTANFKEIEEDQFTVNVSEYTTGVSLVTVNGTNEFGYAYDGQAMYKVAAYGDVYAFLVEGAANTELVTARESGEVVVIAQGYDVNGTGKVDFNDAGAAFGCYNGVYDVAVDMAMYLRADVNGDGVVNTVDVNAILAAY